MKPVEIFVSGWSTTDSELKKSMFQRESIMEVTIKADSVEEAKSKLVDEWECELYKVSGYIYEVTVSECHRTKGNEFSFILRRKLRSIKK